MKRQYQSIIASQFSAHHQITMVSGPRQVGKTTLARRVANQQCYYLNWDDFDDRELLLQGSKAIARHIELERLRPVMPLLILDEIHKFPKWKQLVKGLYDAYHDQCRVLITGSARMDVYKQGGDSLMGRYFNYRLHPLSVREVIESSPLNEQADVQPPRRIADEDFDALLTWGGFPEPYLKRDRRFFNRWSRLRRQQLLREDVRELSKVQALGQLEVLAELLRHQVGQLTSYSSLAKRVRVSVDTIRRWLTTLEAMYYCYAVRPWTKNVTRSLLKEPKYYLWDWSQCPDAGARHENFIASHLLKAVHFWTDTGLGDYGLFFVRDKEKREVDFLISRNGEPWMLVEVKSAAQQSLSPALTLFARQLEVAHVFQVAMDGEYLEHDLFELQRPMIVPAKTFLSQLI